MGEIIKRDVNHTEKHFKKMGTGTAEDPFVDDIIGFKGIDSVLKTGSISTIGDYKQMLGKSTILFNEQLGGNATSVYESIHGGVNMSVLDDGDYVIRETKVTHNYISGNPHLFELTTIDITPIPGVVKRMGYFCSNSVAPFNSNRDGLYLETDDTDIYFKISKGGVEIFSAAQSSWDDPMDGTGASGLTLDPGKFQALVGEFLYLGGTVAKFGFLIEGGIIWCHTFKNSNNLASIFILAPNQPLRWEIRSTGGAADFYHICGKVGTLGKVEHRGISRFHSNGSTHINAGSIGTKYALLGVRPNSRLLNLTVTYATALALSNDKFLLELIMNPTVAGTFDYVAQADQGHDRATGASDGSNTVTGGTITGGIYVDSAGDGEIRIDNLLRPGATIDGVFDDLVLCVTPLGANLDIVGGMIMTVQM